MQLGFKQELAEEDVEAKESLRRYRLRFFEPCRRHNVPMGDIIKDLDGLQLLIEEGVAVFASLPDSGLIQKTLTALVQGARRMSGQATAGLRVS